MHTNPIIVLEDDKDERELITEALKELEIDHELIFFDAGKQLVDYLDTSDKSPFLIICDVNITPDDGFSIREKLEHCRKVYYKSVPFVFLSTTASEHQIRKAYDLHSQGFFIKASSYRQLKELLSAIITYWRLSEQPTTD